MVVRREPERIVRYMHLGTGNYNEATARLYTDMGLFTSDESLGMDISSFFNTITGYSQPTDWRRIEMAPTGMKRRLLRLIRRESERSSKDAPGLIMAKMNSMVDPDIITALYEASCAGVRVRLNVRGICCLRPGVKGLSTNIEVISIVDRFLEHSRIFYFYNGGDEDIYLSSADWMPRNLDRRIELMFPVSSAEPKRRLIDILKTFFDENVKGRWLQPDGSYVRKEGGSRGLRCQEYFMEEAQKRARRAAKAGLREFQPRRPGG
jgi:polyphosphate kinase